MALCWRRILLSMGPCVTSSNDTGITPLTRHGIMIDDYVNVWTTKTSLSNTSPGNPQGSSISSFTRRMQIPTHADSRLSACSQGCHTLYNSNSVPLERSIQSSGSLKGTLLQWPIVHVTTHWSHWLDICCTREFVLMYTNLRITSILRGISSACPFSDAGAKIT